MFKNCLHYCGTTIYEDPNMISLQTYKWCRSKKKRIRKKWGKNPKYKKQLPNLNEMIQFGNSLVCHPITFEKLKEAIDSQQTINR